MWRGLWDFHVVYIRYGMPMMFGLRPRFGPLLRYRMLVNGDVTAGAEEARLSGYGIQDIDWTGICANFQDVGN